MLGLTLTPPQQGDIEFRNVSFAYPTAPDKKALDGINLKIARNSKVALVGDSGAGKSTILHLIARYYDPVDGQVLIDGQDLRAHNSRSIRKHIATVSQDADIFAITILENILYGRHMEDEEGGLELIDEVLDCLRENKPLSAVRMLHTPHYLIDAKIRCECSVGRNWWMKL